MTGKKRYRKMIPAAILCIVGIIVFALLWQNRAPQEGREESSESSGETTAKEEQWRAAETTPLGKYPETVEYTLGKISGANNSNLPIGDT